ncbi:hypothetical protein Q4I30_005550 [Leishmania utingensis]|uniref:Uncharacterized protein n=1 Tax=Leishmania utingensis TaxID=653362 RepID=A0AAW3A9R9_9TRYP
MLTSTEEAYTHYLEHQVVADGVDAAIVRATLQQMGFDEKTVAAMMGDTSTYSLPFSTNSSASSTTSTLISSLKKPRRASGLSATTTPSASSELADAAQFHRVITTPAESTAHAAAPVPAAAVPVTPAPSSIVHERRCSTTDASHPYTFSHFATGAAAGAAPPSSSTSSSTVPSSALSRTLVEGTVAGAVEEFVVERRSGAALSSWSNPELSVCGTEAKGRGAVTLLSRTSSSSLSEATVASASQHAELTAAERASLARWMHEYQALMLSSALPRRASRSCADVPSLSTALLLSPEEAFDEHPAAPSAVACSVRTENDECSAALQDETAAQPPLRWSEAADRVSRKVEDSDSSVAGSDGATSSNCSTFIRTEGGYSPYTGELLRQDGTDAAEKTQDGGAGWVSERHYRSAAARPLYRAAHAAAPPPTRRAVPKAKSPAFVPTCGICVPRCATGCIRCRFDVAQCRHPYREAQDVRIVRASHVAMTNNGEYEHRAIALSCCRARQFDAAQQTQHTARAQPTSGRRVPVMHAPIGASVQPRAGLASGRQTSTLPVKVKTDRVRLAQYYRHQWEEQERRSSASGRSAAWNARYVLLSCAGWAG